MQDVSGGIVVGVENCTADLALEDRALSLPSSQAAACGTCLGSVPGRNELDSNSSLFPFVEKETLKLVKSPVGEEPVLLVPVPCSTYPFQVFQNQNPISSCVVCQCPAYAVVDISHKTFLPAAHLPKMPFGRTSAFGLQPCPKPDISLLSGKNIVPAVKPSCRRGNKVVDAPVHSDNGTCLLGFDRRRLYGNHQPEFAIIALDKVAFLGFPSGEFLKILWDVELHLKPPAFCQKACGFLVEIYRAAPCVVMDGFAGKNRALAFSFDCSLDGGTGILVGDNCKLGREAKSAPEGRIIEMVHPEGVGFLMVITGSHNRVHGIGHDRQIIIKHGALPRQFLDNRLDGFHHNYIMDFDAIKRLPDSGLPVKVPKTTTKRSESLYRNSRAPFKRNNSEIHPRIGEMQFLLRLKSWVSLQGII